MFYQKALPKFRFSSRVDSLLTKTLVKVAAMFEKAESANTLPFTVPFHVGAYKDDVVVVIKMGAYIHEALILCGCSNFTVVFLYVSKLGRSRDTFQPPLALYHVFNLNC